MRLLREMYRRWPFFRTVIASEQIVLAQADPKIAELYSKLEDEEARREIFQEFLSQYKLATKLILEIAQRRFLLEKNSLLRRSIEARNPYVDSINYIQVRLLKEKREDRYPIGSSESTLISAGLLLSIVGIAAGMKNTG